MKALLLYNTRSGKGRIARLLSKIVAIFSEAAIEVRTKLLNFEANPFDDEEDIELVVVCGGDGTVNFVVNSMRSKGLDITLGIIPAGTANDFASAIGMKQGILRAARQIASGSTRRVDCGIVNGSAFVNVLSFGVLTTTSQQTSDSEKHLVGKLAYVRIGTRDLLTMHSIPLVARINGEEFNTEAAMFLAFNGKSAGQFRLAPEAKVDDGMLDVLILDYNNMAKTCWNMMHYLVGGKPEAVHYIRTNKIELISPNNERTDIDGQPGPDFPLNIECLPGALKIRG